jgi:hypothetical protein
VTVGTIHDPVTEVTEPFEPVTAYPLQLVLYQLLPLVLSAHIPGAINVPARANAGLNAANSISEPMRNADNLANGFIRFHPFFVYKYTINKYKLSDAETNMSEAEAAIDESLIPIENAVKLFIMIGCGFLRQHL